PATSAVPKPAASTFSMNSVSMIPLRLNDIAARIVFVIVMVRIDRNIFRMLPSEEGDIARVVAYFLRASLAADMAVNAEHPVRRCHHHMQIMRHHHNTATALVTYLLQHGVKFRLAVDIKPL